MNDRPLRDVRLVHKHKNNSRRMFEHSNATVTGHPLYVCNVTRLTRVATFICLSLTYFGVYVMAVPSKQQHTPITVTSTATATMTNPTTNTITPTRQMTLQQQYGNQWWMYRLRQQQQKLLEQQERFLRQFRQNTPSSFHQHSNNQTTITTSVIQIIETEYMDELTGRWTALHNGTDCSKSSTEDENDDGLKHQRNRDDVIMIPQWTDAMTGEPVVAPSDYVLYNDSNMNQTWIGEWKIAVTSSSQSGWEYSRRRRPKKHSMNKTRHRISPLLQYTHRQRIWLRTVATTTIDTGDIVSQHHLQPLKIPKRKSTKKRRHANFYHRIVEAIQEDWNFKGFGLTLVKSVLYRNAFGIAFRIPVTLHFKTWERYPALPSIGSSIAIFLPQLCICLFINLSLRIEYIQLTLYYIAHVIPSLCTTVLLLLLRGLALAVSALLYPFTRQPLLLATIQDYDEKVNNGNVWWYMLLPKQSRPILLHRRRHPESDERIDVTWSFRWSLDRGYEFRTTCSHFYAIPLTTVMETVIPLLPLSDNKLTIYSTTSIMKMMDWIPRHEAAIGCSFVGPAYHDKTGLFITANTLLSLSGFYFSKQPKIRNSWSNLVAKHQLHSPQDKHILNSANGQRVKEVDSEGVKHVLQGNATDVSLTKTVARIGITN